jgi:16S rRNA G527 N7-methylase RsmG|tara:strand:+ start:90 stop:338 length:249 start_codon:yes stop_codon:yes gene_type:complete
MREMKNNKEVNKIVCRALDQLTTLNQLLLESSENSTNKINLENLVNKINNLQEEIHSLKNENEMLKDNMIQYYHERHQSLPF